MKKPQQKNIITIIGISIILLAVIAKRLFIKNYPMESTYSFLAGFATVLIAFLIFKRFFKKE
ncbi:MAG: hypothetical protein WCG08_03930 [Paludibacter sp.]